MNSFYFYFVFICFTVIKTTYYEFKSSPKTRIICVYLNMNNYLSKMLERDY